MTATLQRDRIARLETIELAIASERQYMRDVKAGAMDLWITDSRADEIYRSIQRITTLKGLRAERQRG